MQGMDERLSSAGGQLPTPFASLGTRAEPQSELSTQYLHKVREHQQSARYADLLPHTDAHLSGVLYHRYRSASGLIGVAFVHGHLTATQRHMLAEFRLHQYLLYGWYDVQVCAEADMQLDPAFEHLSDASIHVLVGTTGGRLLAYFCVCTAQLDRSDGQVSEPGDIIDPNIVITQQHRPQFPTEKDLFGTHIFASLPALHDIPLGRMREFARLIRNNVTRSMTLSAFAVAESILIVAKLTMNRANAIDVSLGCMEIEARRFAAKLGMPILYAPSAEPLPHPERSKNAEYWSRRGLESENFWPFVIATEDVLAGEVHFGHLDRLLDSSEREIRRGLIDFQHSNRMLPCHALLPEDEASSVIWTPDPFFNLNLAQKVRRPHQRVPMGVTVIEQGIA